MIKKILSSLGVVGFVYCMSDAKQLNGNIELITSRYAELYLVQETENSPKKLLDTNHKEIFVSNSPSFNFYQTYQLGNEDILVFLFEEQSENCTKFFIVGVQKDSISSTPSFGNCSDFPEIVQNSDNLELHFPMTQTTISQTVVYKDKKIEVTERKVSKK